MKPFAGASGSKSFSRKARREWTSAGVHIQYVEASSSERNAADEAFSVACSEAEDLAELRDRLLKLRPRFRWRRVQLEFRLFHAR
jgi:hypothetical protein